jgi:succinyl-diaminopimelate desuccinylase
MTTTSDDPLDPLTHAVALIRCPSVTPDQAGALDYMQTVLGEAGFDCRRLVFSGDGGVDTDNLYARIGQGAPHLCLAGHIDVVPPGDAAAWSHPPFAAVIEDGILHGRGSADMKGGVAAAMAAALLDQLPDHRRRGRARHQRHAQGGRLDARERRGARSLPARRTDQ